MSDPRTIQGYFGVTKDNDQPTGFGVFAKLEDLNEWEVRQRGEVANDAAPRSVKGALPIDQALLTRIAQSEEDRKLIGFILGFRDAMAALRSVIFLLQTATPAVQRAMIIQNILPFARATLDQISSKADVEIFAFDYGQYLSLLRNVKPYYAMSAGFKALPSTVLMSIAATFDSYLSDIVAFFLSLHPEKYVNSTKPVSLRDIIELGSSENILSHVIANDVAEAMRGSHSQQMEFVEKNLGIKIITLYPRWDKFLEVFERRNLAAHGNMIVNRVYLKSYKYKPGENAEVKLGDKLENTPEYIQQTIDVVLELGFIVTFQLWIKHLSQSSEVAFLQLNEFCISLIQDGRFQLAERLLDHALEVRKTKRSDRVNRMIAINLANALKKQGKQKEFERVLGRNDWSACSSEFIICLAAVRGNVDRVLELLPEIGLSGEINATSFREWPVFDWVREDPRIVECFLKTYGEPMTRGQSIQPSTDSNVG